MPSFDAIVIGSGFAGLSAATRLAQSGARVLVVEAKGRLGGRATSFPDPDTGEIIDNGQHVLFGAYRETFAFLARIGTQARLLLQPALEVPYILRDGRRTVLRCPVLPPPLHLLAGVLEWDAMRPSHRLPVLKMVGPLRLAVRHFRGETASLPASPDETVDRWLEFNGQTPELRRLLWEPLALAALNQSPAEAAALPFVRVLASLFGGAASDAAIALPGVTLLDLFAEPSRAYVEARGGTVLTGAAATVRYRDGRALGVEIRDRFEPAKAVIAAVPWHAVGALFPDGGGPLAPVLEAARAMDSCPIVTVNVWLDRPLLGTRFAGLPGRVFQWVFDRRTILGTEGSHLSLIASGAARLVAMTNDELIDLAMNELAGSYPATRQVGIKATTVVREPRATFSLAPGQPPRPSTATPIAGLFLAGDWIATGLPGTIESAVVSGHRAADAVRR